MECYNCIFVNLFILWCGLLIWDRENTINTLQIILNFKDCLPTIAKILSLLINNINKFVRPQSSNLSLYNFPFVSSKAKLLLLKPTSYFSFSIEYKTLFEARQIWHKMKVVASYHHYKNRQVFCCFVYVMKCSHMMLIEENNGD